MSGPRDPTQFTRESAERIANVVRAVELAPRAGRPLTFDRVDDPPRRKVFRIATFTGAWAINSAKTVTFKYQTQTPNTASVTNLFFPLVPGPSGTKDCAIAKEGTAWFLIDVPLRTATATFISSTEDVEVLTDVSFDGNACAFNKTQRTITVIDATATASYLVLDV